MLVASLIQLGKNNLGLATVRIQRQQQAGLVVIENKNRRQQGLINPLQGPVHYL